MGASIAQCSFGSSYPDGFSPSAPAPWYHAGWIQAYESAIAPLQEKGVLVVASAGNEYLDLDLLSSLGYAYNPCLVNLSNVLCVAASGPDDRLLGFSNRGQKTVHLASPGLAVMSTMNSEPLYPYI
jgi:serine protease